MTAPEITDHDDQAADLARHEADTARTENMTDRKSVV